MKQRSKSRGAAAKSGRSDKLPPKQGQSVKAGATKTKAAPSSAPSPDLEIAHLTRELHEARQRQTATSEVLRLISSSREDLNSSFDAILENATRICEAKLGLMYSYDGKLFHNAAMRLRHWWNSIGSAAHLSHQRGHRSIGC
jgi:two-component system, NtrC family, sensor kinase